MDTLPSPKRGATESLIRISLAVGSRCGPFPKALAALVSRKIQVAPLIGEILPLTDGLSAFEKAGRPGSLKIVLKIS